MIVAVWMFGRNNRLVCTFEWLTLLPARFVFPHISHIAIMDPLYALRAIRYHASHYRRWSGGGRFGFDRSNDATHTQHCPDAWKSA
jgi:hypothetical protein